MTRDEETAALVRDLTMELVRFARAGETLAIINAIGRQLASMTAQDREQAETEELRQVRIHVLRAFCTMFGFDLDSVLLWKNGQREIPGEVCEMLAYLRQERMKGETR